MKTKRGAATTMNVEKKQRLEWGDYLEKYISSWPEWKKNSGFCYHTSVLDFGRSLFSVQLTMGKTDDVK